MSDDESFVILGTSPSPSMQRDGIDSGKSSNVNSLSSDSPGSGFASLKNSQLNELQNAKETPSGSDTTKLNSSIQSTSMQQSQDSKIWSKPILSASIQSPAADKTVTPEEQNSLSSVKRSNVNSVTSDTPVNGLSSSNKGQSNGITTQINATTSMQRESMLWSRPDIPTVNTEATETSINSLGNAVRPTVSVEIQNNILPVSLDDCALQSPLATNSQTKTINTTKPTANSAPTSLKKSLNESDTNSKSTDNSLASSFIMGDVNADVLKTSVYSQFPSISMQASAEDVVKLQNMVTEYMQLKSTLDKVNNTMKLFYQNSLHWKDKMQEMETHYKQQLAECQQQIDLLHDANRKFKASVDLQNEQTKALDISRQKDREEMDSLVITISEKTALIKNMQAHLAKLEQKQLATFEFVPEKPAKEAKEEQAEDIFIKREEHELQLKEMERKLSELLASNLDLKDMEKQYIDEVTCLKVNLTSAEELIKEHRAAIAVLNSRDADTQKSIDELKLANDELLKQNNELSERIALLEQQNEVYRKDFEMERESRATAEGEKHRILMDLKGLQRKNQELIEDHQKMVKAYERKVSSIGGSSTSAHSFVAAAAAAQSFMDNPQRPIRDLTPPSPSSQAVAPPSVSVHRCPVCNKPFKSLSVLQSHVNDCIDKI